MTTTRWALLIVFTVLACLCAGFLFRGSVDDRDVRFFLGIGFAGGIIGALFPWPA